MFQRILNVLVAALFLAACGQSAAGPTVTPERQPTQEPIATRVSPTEALSPTHASPTDTALPESPTATSGPTPAPATWQDWPVVPGVSDRAREIYARGQELGRDPRKFAKVGDCGGTPSWFLGAFDGDPQADYQLGEYAYLQEAITFFKGSFARQSVAAGNGFNTASVLLPGWADTPECKSGELRLDCELRLTNASYVLIMLGTNDNFNPEAFEPRLRLIIESAIDKGVVPILATKADNREQDWSYNATIVRLAQEYDVPLWNFWREVQGVPYTFEEGGLYLRWAGYHFDNPETMQYGWPHRNLTALQVLDAVWRGMNQ